MADMFFPSFRKYSLPLLCVSTFLSLSLNLASISHAQAASTSKKQNTSQADPTQSPQTADQIIAVVNGQILTERDVDDRARLFVISTGLPIQPDIMARMKGQIIHQLIDERLKMQEILKRHINIGPEQIAAAINNIEARNGMPKNALRDRLASDGISLTTLVDQIRVQIGWMQVLREELGPRSRVTPTQISQREQALQKESDKPQYYISEIFVSVIDPNHDEAELNFTNTIISELRKGAPFPIVAAQFSQDQSALDGGSMGWVQEDHLEPEVVNIVRKMPIGAISNPIKVPGGYVIATVHAKRSVGKQMATLLNVRQAFFPFATPLDPTNPTAEQRDTLAHATKASQTLSNCNDIEQLNAQLGNKHPTNPGLQIEERLSPQMKAVLGALPINRATRPLIAPDGIALLMICSRDERNLAQQTPGQIADQLMNERVEQAARQMQRSLQRRAIIQLRNDSKIVQFRRH